MRERYAALITADTVAAAWLPFLIATPRTAAAHLTTRNMADPALRVLGVTMPRTPPWDRPAQVVLGCLLGGLAMLRRRWPTVLLLGVGARMALDPGVHGYCTARIMTGALVWNILGPRPLPLASLVSFGP